ncbi:hypothetical protein [Lachnotalea glycerini]|uniref:Uncharacterized protein n=1 Tax=Lachnotalea glycerini TaxID=1763509 RepID=A0A371JC58_9FIRM|nr:hypothetical protein [Lachnotalea glycerini]RDY30322.1 hypothetical protein CG710_015425 [Lachnotalea glycerini]
MGNLNGYHVDGSKLSSSELIELEHFFKLREYDHYDVAGEPGVYTVMYYKNYDPIPDNPFPDKCIFRKIS